MMCVVGGRLQFKIHQLSEVYNNRFTSSFKYWNMEYLTFYGFNGNPKYGEYIKRFKFFFSMKN